MGDDPQIGLFLALAVSAAQPMQRALVLALLAQRPVHVAPGALHLVGFRVSGAHAFPFALRVLLPAAPIRFDRDPTPF